MSASEDEGRQWIQVYYPRSTVYLRATRRESSPRAASWVMTLDVRHQGVDVTKSHMKQKALLFSRRYPLLLLTPKINTPCFFYLQHSLHPWLFPSGAVSRLMLESIQQHLHTKLSVSSSSAEQNTAWENLNCLSWPATVKGLNFCPRPSSWKAVVQDMKMVVGAVSG